MPETTQVEIVAPTPVPVVTVVTPSTEPTPVKLVSPSTVPVEIVNPEVLAPEGSTDYQSQRTDPSLAATTTFQQDLTTAGQRKVNLIWEYTQAMVAIFVVALTMIGSIYGMIYGLQIPNLIAVAFGTVVGFYFSRTNHAAIGSIGAKPLQPYVGR